MLSFFLGALALMPPTYAQSFVNTSCGSCTLFVPAVTEYFWVPDLAETATNTTQIYTATTIYYYHGSTTVPVVKTLPASNYSQYLPITTPAVYTVTITYGEDQTSTTAITYPTPFFDYQDIYTVLGSSSTAGGCELLTDTILTPASHPPYPQVATATPSNASDVLGTDYTVISTIFPTIEVDPTVYITIGVTTTTIVDQTATYTPPYASLVSAADSFYSSVFSDQPYVSKCGPPSPGSLTVTISETVIETSNPVSSKPPESSGVAPTSPLTHTSADFLTTTKQSSVGAAEIESILRSAAAIQASESIVSVTAPNGQTSPVVDQPPASEKPTEPSLPAPSQSPDNTLATTPSAPGGAPGNTGSQETENTPVVTTDARGSTTTSTPTNVDTYVAAKPTAGASNGDSNGDSTVGLTPSTVVIGSNSYVLYPTQVVNTAPNAAGGATLAGSTVPEVVISGETLTLGGAGGNTVTINNTPVHLTVVTTGGSSITEAVFGTGASATTISVGFTAPATTDVGGYICGGVGGCATGVQPFNGSAPALRASHKGLLASALVATWFWYLQW